MLTSCVAAGRGRHIIMLTPARNNITDRQMEGQIDTGHHFTMPLLKGIINHQPIRPNSPLCIFLKVHLVGYICVATGQSKVVRSLLVLPLRFSKISII